MVNRSQRRTAASRGEVSQPMAPGTVLPHDVQVTFEPVSSFYAAGSQLAVAGNDFSLLFNRPVMGKALVDGAMIPVAQVQPVVEVHLSPQTMKDLSILIAQAVEGYESEFGVIETAFTRVQKAAKAITE